MLFFLFVFIAINNAYNNNLIQTLYNAEWELDRPNSGSVIEILNLMGIGEPKSTIVNNLQINEIYNLSSTSFGLRKRTHYSNTNDLFKLGVEERGNDELMGEITRKVTFANNKIHMHMVRTNNDVLISTRAFAPRNSNKIVYTLNYTTHDNIKASCVRYFVRK